ncbi:DNA polymerase III subunit alpha [Miltoncostaea marina]|uniref:DNA polymerase III subunit alpha n=1 Tax=Miltoncostaea marina TaxID=2843215 RepID=UPI001C3E16FF|nr:DNA polymerase III subunit alpha [Miltoncostaea marina]
MPAADPPFVHLHVHSDRSVLDGACEIERLLNRVEQMGQGAVALTDHGVMSGAVDLYRKATKRGITPVVGLEAYVVPDHRERPTREKRNHLTLLAETTEGYYNLIKLCSAGYLEGYHRKPRISHELMERHSDGIIALSGCLSGVVCSSLEQGDTDAAAAELDRLRQIFGPDDVYAEIQHAGLPVQTGINEHLRRIATDLGIPMVATCDAHYPCREDADAHEALLAIQTRDVLSNPKRFRFDTKEFYLKTGAEMAAALPDFLDALPVSVEIAERCSALSLPLGDIKLPRFPVPGGETAEAYLERLCREGLDRRYPGGWPAAAEERLRFELDVIREMGFSSYFLIVWDYTRWARENGVAVGPGRGSAAGSLVSFALRIVDVDPLAHDLLFERFLNPGRKSMPDIDTDFSVAGRDRVVAYVTEKYGQSAVARIGTFGKLLARAVVRDAGRVLGHTYGQVDRIAKLVPERPIGIKLEEAMKPGTELAQAYAEDPVTKQIIDTARPLEGLVRNEGVHAAGVVIAPSDITDYVPVRMDDEGNVVTQVPDHDVEALGLLKMDFLGLRNLDVIEGALRLIADRTGEDLDIDTVPLDDPATYAMLARGDAVGVFQFESSGMREALREVRPTEFADLIALVALYRPGPMAFIPTYARNKRDPSLVTFADPRLEPITGPTYGVAVYQEQLMAISRQLAGFSPSRADDLRKAVGKKDKVLMASLKDEFIEGCLASGTDRKVAQDLWGLCEAAGDYSFNKSHAACYALLAYRTAYLKANHPAEYMASLLSSVMDTKDRVPFYVACCTDMGLSVLPPDVNVSRADFAVTGEREIRFGLTATKGVGDNAVAAIIAARDAGGPFESIWDFCRRVDQAQVNKRALESLVRAGALDCTGDTRLGMLETIPAAVAQAARRRQDLAAGQESLFGAMGGGDDGAADPVVLEVDAPVPTIEMPKEELLAAEKEALGLYVSSHPLQDCRRQLARAVTCGLAALGERADGEPVTVGGMIGAVKNITTRRGEPMMFVRLDDLEGQVEVVVVPAVLAEARELLTMDAMLLMTGRVDQKGEGETKLVAQSVRAFVPEEGGEEERLRLRVPMERLAATPLPELRRVLVDHPGPAKVIVDVETPAGRRRLRLSDEFSVDPRANSLVAELKTLFGERCLA